MELGKHIKQHIPNYFTDVVIVTFGNGMIISLGVRGKCSIRGLDLDSFLFTIFRNISL